MRARFASVLSVALPLVVACGGKQPAASPDPGDQEPPPDVVQPAGADGYGGDEYGDGEYGGGAYGGAGYGGEEAWVPPPPAPPTLVGRWVSPCFPGAQKKTFQKLTFDMTVDRWDLAYDTFSDAGCARRTVDVHIAGAYSFGGQSPTAAGAWEGNFTFDTREVTADDKKSAAAVGKACGIKKLKPGVKTDIHAKGCPAFGIHPSATCGADYDLVAAEGNTLRFGARPADNNLCTEDKRPTALDPQLAFEYDWVASGLANCGAYGAAMVAFSTCPKVPQESRDALTQSWGMMMEGLRGAAGNEEARKAADDACKQGVDALTQAFTAMGC